MSDIRSICVFCGSKTGADPAYEVAALKLGDMIAERGIRLVYGGGRIGLMGLVAEQVAAGGGEVIGIIPDFLMKLEVGNEKVGELIITDSMHSRKRRMFELSDGFVSLPGGLGTLDETAEPFPVPGDIENNDWLGVKLELLPGNDLEGLVEDTIEGGFAHAKVRDLYLTVSTPEAVFAALEAAPEPDREVLTSHL